MEYLYSLDPYLFYLSPLDATGLPSFFFLFFLAQDGFFKKTQSRIWIVYFMCVCGCFWHLSNGRDRQEVAGVSCQNFLSNVVQAPLHTNACRYFLPLFSLLYRHAPDRPHLHFCFPRCPRPPPAGSPGFCSPEVLWLYVTSVQLFLNICVLNVELGPGTLSRHVITKTHYGLISSGIATYTRCMTTVLKLLAVVRRDFSRWTMDTALVWLAKGCDA